MARSAGWKTGVYLLSAAGLLGTACASATAPPSSPSPPRATPAQNHHADEGNPKEVAPAPMAEGDREAELPARLSAEHISSVIAAAAPRVKAKCWQASLDNRGPEAPLTARVLVQAEIEPSGAVASARTDDAPAGYPELADCVLTLVRTLTFHRASASTNVNIPFVFDATSPNQSPR